MTLQVFSCCFASSESEHNRETLQIDYGDKIPGHKLEKGQFPDNQPSSLMLKDSSKGGRSQQYYAGKMRSPQFSTMSSQSKLGSSLESSTRVTNTSTAMGTGAAFAIAPSASGRQLTSEIGMSGSTVMIFGFDAPSIRPEEINFSTPETDEDGRPSLSESQCTSGTYHLASAVPVRDGGGTEAPKPRPSTIAENDSHEDVSVRMAALAHPESTSEQQQRKMDPKSESKVRLTVKVNGEIICQDSTLGDTSNDSSSSPLHRHLENPRSTVSADDHRGLPKQMPGSPKQMPGSPLTPTSCSDAREPVPSRKASLLTAQLASPSNSIDFSQLSPVHRKPSSSSSLNTSQVAASLRSRIKGSGGGGDGEGAAAAAPQGTSERRLPRPTRAIASATARTSALREMLLKQQEVAPHGYVFDSATGVWIQAPSPAAYADTQAGHLLSTLRQVNAMPSYPRGVDIAMRAKYGGLKSMHLRDIDECNTIAPGGEELLVDIDPRFQRISTSYPGYC